MAKISKGKLKYIKALTRFRIFSSTFGEPSFDLIDAWDRWMNNPMQFKYPSIPISFTIMDLSDIIHLPKGTA